MELNADQMIHDAIRDGLRKGIEERLTRNYSNPFDKVLTDCVDQEARNIRGIVSDAIKECVNDSGFVGELKKQLRTVLAKTLIQRFGGELEKSVNALKSDPTTRARITLAIEEIVNTSKG